MRGAFRTLLILIVLFAVGFVLLTYWRGPASLKAGDGRSPAIGTSGAIDMEKARERGAEIGAKTAVAAAKLKDTMSEAGLTTKIKAKMTLDDSLKSRAIDVTTNGTTVTLSGSVGSRAQHDRAVALARETAGVTDVVDRLSVR
jgi:hyperosmotically inducible protein